MKNLTGKLGLLTSLVAVAIAAGGWYSAKTKNDQFAAEIAKINSRLEARSADRSEAGDQSAFTAQINEQQDDLSSQQRLNNAQTTDLAFLKAERLRQDKRLDDLSYQVDILRRDMNGLSKDLARIDR